MVDMSIRDHAPRARVGGPANGEKQNSIISRGFNVDEAKRYKYCECQKNQPEKSTQCSRPCIRHEYAGVCVANPWVVDAASETQCAKKHLDDVYVEHFF